MYYKMYWNFDCKMRALDVVERYTSNRDETGLDVIVFI